MKIQVAKYSSAGILKYRVLDPHVKIQNLNQGIDIEINRDDFNKQGIDAIFVHSSAASNSQLFYQLMATKTPLIVDVDDYWILPNSHYLYWKFKKDKIGTRILSLLKKAILCTTTTKYLADKIRPINKNIVVIPNSIDKDEAQFQPNKIESNMFRYGLATGSSHLKDMSLLNNVPIKLSGKNSNVKLVLGGFDTRIKNPENGTIKNDYNKSVWKKYEEKLTNNFSLVSQSCRKHLQMGVKSNYDFTNEKYERIWQKPIESYGEIYNSIDLSIAPLLDTQFNRLKSELKIIESGFHGIPIVCSDLPMYADILKNVKGGFLVKEKKAHKDFIKYIQVYAKNKELLKEHGSELKKHCLENFELGKNTLKRIDAYKHYLK